LDAREGAKNLSYTSPIIDRSLLMIVLRDNLKSHFESHRRVELKEMIQRRRRMNSTQNSTETEREVKRQKPMKEKRDSSERSE
jgi:hypothetical protein